MNKQKSKALCSSRGFTIIELIVVIAIIAVLAGIVMINVAGYITKSKDAAIRSDLSNIALGMGACYAETGTYVSCSGSTHVQQNLLTDIATKNGGTAPTFGTPTASAYCVSAKWASSASTTCVSSTGVTTDGLACSGTTCQ